MGHAAAQEQTERLALHRGFGRSLSVSFEIALVPLFAGGIGYLIDRVVGLVPVVTVVFALLALAAQGIKLYYGYGHDMAVIETTAPWKRTGAPALPLASPVIDDLAGFDTDAFIADNLDPARAS